MPPPASRCAGLQAMKPDGITTDRSSLHGSCPTSKVNRHSALVIHCICKFALIAYYARSRLHMFFEGTAHRQPQAAGYDPHSYCVPRPRGCLCPPGCFLSVPSAPARAHAGESDPMSTCCTDVLQLVPDPQHLGRVPAPP